MTAEVLVPIDTVEGRLEPDTLRIQSNVIHRLPLELPHGQLMFDSTGGLHAAALFNSEGKLEILREDVDQQNALDKVIGDALQSGFVSLRDSILSVSGRASLELVQSALLAGVAVLATSGPPSSLALNTAERCGMTLIGFLRDGRFNVYSGAHRVTGVDPAGTLFRPDPDRSSPYVRLRISAVPLPELKRSQGSHPREPGHRSSVSTKLLWRLP